MAYSKVILNGTTLIDVTQKTVDASNLLSGYTALKNDGTNVTGTYEPPTVSLQAKTNIAPSTSSQTITPDQGYDGLSSVQINAMPSGTVGTPTATKGTVSNHAVSVTPSVTNTTGYITGGTKTGTAVSVTASELVSGTKSITANGTGIDVTDYASVDVAVPSSAPTLQAKTNIDPATSSQTITADTGYDGLSSVQINAMPQAEYSVPTYKTISNHSVTFNGICNVTTAGYIAAGAHSGSTDVVTAASLVSGTLDVTDNGIVDVTNYQYANVNVSGGGGGVETMLVSDIYASGMIYYTDENMTPQSGYQITGLYLPSGTLILVYNNGPAPFPSQPTGVTEIARYGSEIKGQYIVYSVLTMAHGGSND